MAVATVPDHKWKAYRTADEKKPKKDRACFYIRALKRRQRVKVIALVGKYTKVENLGELLSDPVAADEKGFDLERFDMDLSKVLTMGLAGWSNFKDKKGKAWPWEADEKGEPSEDCLEALEVHELWELAIDVVNLNCLEGEDKKKSK